MELAGQVFAETKQEQARSAEESHQIPELRVSVSSAVPLLLAASPWDVTASPLLSQGTQALSRAFIAPKFTSHCENSAPLLRNLL